MGDAARNADECAGPADDELVTGTQFHLPVENVELLFDRGVPVRAGVPAGQRLELERGCTHAGGGSAQNADRRAAGLVGESCFPATSRWEGKRVSADSPLRSLIQAFNAHDLDQIMSFFTDECVLETLRGSQPWGTRYSGRDAVREGLAARFADIPDVHYGDDEHWLCGDHAVSKWLLTGTTR